MRGKHYPAQSHLSLHGITPADAGKTPPLSQICRHDKDHPRGCGENFPIAQPRYLGRGSPPRMRGKLRGHLATVKQNGITPADAGKTSIFCRRKLNKADHPRGCGENFFACRNDGFARGSPPRMRGKPLCFVLFEVVNGITPADAGKTHFRSWRRRVCRDHPRGCGENSRAMEHRPRYLGSPPRMRGKHDDRKTQLQARPITPADAGKT